MSSNTTPTSIFIPSQFPDFYEEEGPDLLLFVQAYYEWMEQNGGILDYSRNLMNNRDVDNTVDQFVEHFRTEYLQNLPAYSQHDTAFLVKHIQDLYKSKGTPRALDLVFRLFFGEDVELYYPKEDILKVDDGTWTIPIYLEVSVNDKTVSFIGKKIIGSLSGASAVVENIVRKRLGSKLFDVVFISNIIGNFEYGEQISVDGNPTGCPYVIGSTTNVEVISGGANHVVGEIFSISSNNGIGGLARVSSIVDGTGQVNFSLLDSGWGYTADGNTQVIVSNTIISVSNTNFQRWETIEQPLNQIYFTNWSGNSVSNSINKQINGYANLTSSVVVANGTILAYDNTSNSVTVCLNNPNTMFNIATYFTVGTSNSSTFTLGANGIINCSLTANVVGTNSNNGLGVFNIKNVEAGNNNITFYTGNNVYVYGTSSNTYANLTSCSTGAYATFRVGSISNIQDVMLYTDTFIENSATLYNQAHGALSIWELMYDGLHYKDSTGNTYPTMIKLANGSFVNTTSNVGLGFPKYNTGTCNTVLNTLLNKQAFNIGSIGILTGINPGTQYNQNPIVSVYDPMIAGINQRNLKIYYNINSGAFSTGETVVQNIGVTNQNLNLNISTGTIQNGESVGNANTIASSTLIGQVSGISANSIAVNIIKGNSTFSNNQTIYTFSSGLTANVISEQLIANSYVQSSGKVISVDTQNDILTILPYSIYQTFNPGQTIQGTSSNTNATIRFVIPDMGSNALGDNANVATTILSANGIVQSLEIIDSGLGHLQNEQVELISQDTNTAISGKILLNNQGVGEGYFKNSNGFLDDGKYLRDDEYYQEYSYEIRVGIGIAKYSKLLKEVFHVAGTAMFGNVLKTTIATINCDSQSATVTINT